MKIFRTLSVTTSLLAFATAAQAQSPFGGSSGGSVFAAALTPGGLADLVSPSELVSSEGAGGLVARGTIDIEDVDILAAMTPDGLADLVSPSEFVPSEGVGGLAEQGSIDIEDVDILVDALNADNGSSSASIEAVFNDSGLPAGDVEDLAARAAVPTPEPSSFVLFASGIAAMGFVRRRRNA